MNHKKLKINRKKRNENECVVKMIWKKNPATENGIFYKNPEITFDFSEKLFDEKQIYALSERANILMWFTNLFEMINCASV